MKKTVHLEKLLFEVNVLMSKISSVILTKEQRKAKLGALQLAIRKADIFVNEITYVLDEKFIWTNVDITSVNTI